jgi:predicted site-specific integrase-resolvase
MSKFSISEAAKIKGVSPSTLRRWESEGKLIPERTASGHRRYSMSQLLGVGESHRAYTIGYVRVSSHDQKQDLERQKEIIELFCRTEDASFEEDLANDVLEIITVFSARLYGSRSGKNKKMVEEFKKISEKL